MSVVKEFYDTTVDFIQLLQQEKHPDRDVKIKQIQEFLEKREGFMMNMKPPFSQNDQQLGKQLIELNHKVIKLLEDEKVMIHRDIVNLNKMKKSTNKYINPYQSLAIDGVFYDKRK